MGLKRFVAQMTKHTDQYEKLNAEITELTFQRAFPQHRLSQQEWEAIQAQIEEKKKQRAEFIAKETA